jgi:maltose O-acetyltransferase
VLKKALYLAYLDLLVLWYKFAGRVYQWEYIQYGVSKYVGKLGVGLRRKVYKKYFRHFGENVVIREGVTFLFPEKIELKDGCGFNSGCWVNGAGGFVAEKDSLVGPYTVIHTANHLIPPRPKRIKDSGWEYAAVRLRENCWIAAHCTILPGVVIGRGAVVAAGAVVTKNVPDFTIVAGVPAKELRKR